jgi:hypothetical protein
MDGGTLLTVPLTAMACIGTGGRVAGCCWVWQSDC